MEKYFSKRKLKHYGLLASLISYYLVNHQMSSNFEKIRINQVRLVFFHLKWFSWKIFLKHSILFNLPIWMNNCDYYLYKFEFPKLGASIFKGFWNFMLIYLLIMCRNFQLSNKKTRLYLLWRQEFSQILCVYNLSVVYTNIVRINISNYYDEKNFCCVFSRVKWVKKNPLIQFLESNSQFIR